MYKTGIIYNTRLLSLAVLTLLCSPLDSLAQFNLARETRFYVKLIETGEKINDLYGQVDDVKSKTSFFRDAAYKAARKQPLNTQAGTLVSAQAEELINQITAYADSYELPEFEEIPAVGPPPGGSRQSVSKLMSRLTEAAVHYHAKLKDYEGKQKEITVLLMKLKELKRENTRAADLLEDVLRSGGLAIGQQALFNDWYNFNIVFSRRIGESVSTLNTRKKRWESILKQRTEEYNRFRSNVLMLLQLEEEALQEDFRKAEEKAKELTARRKELEELVKNLEILKDRIKTVESDLRYYRGQVNSLESANRNYRSRIRGLERDLEYIQSDSYKLNFNKGCRNNICPYGKCPNNTPYDRCEHAPQTKKFRNKRASDARKKRKSISSYHRSINRNNSTINAHNSRINNLEQQRQQIQEQLNQLPDAQARLEQVKKEEAEFRDRLDIFYAFELMFTNTRNTDTLNNL